MGRILNIWAFACSISVVQPSGALANSIDLYGFESLFGEPVTTSVTGTPMRASQVPVNMTIVTAEDIRRSGALSIPEVLGQLAGIDVLQWTANHFDVGIRGYNQAYNPRLLVMINGRQVYLDHYGLTAWSALPVQMGEIHQIEVVRGPNTALFGFNAVSGVVNIITHNPLYQQVSEISSTIGTHGTFDINALATVGIPNNYGIRVSAGYVDMGNHDDESPLADSLFDTDPERQSFAVDAAVAIGTSTQLAVDVSHVDAQYNEIEGAYTYANSNYNIGSLRARLFHDSDYGLWTLSAYQNKLTEKLGSPGLSIVGGTRLRGRNLIQVASIENQFVPAANHNLRFLAEYRDNTVDTSHGGGTDVGYHVASASGAWSWQILDSLSTIVSARYDRLDLHADGDPFTPLQSEDYDQQHNEYSYNLATLYRPTPTDSFRLSAARGIQTPSLLEFGIVFPPQPILGNIFIVGNPELSPTTIQTYEFNYERDLPQLASKLGLSIFHQAFDELKSLPALGVAGLEFINGLPATRSQNIGKSSAWGIEAEISGDIGQYFDYALNYSYVNIDDDLDINQNSLDYGALFEDATPHHLIKAKFGADWENWEADMFVNWQSERDLIDNPTGFALSRTELDSVFNMNARIGYRVNDRMHLSVSGSNLLGDNETTNGLDIDRRLLFTAKIKLN